MDEFDAVARARGGRGGKGDQGDAGVARDSVVNQLLAKMDGVQPLPVPTLVIGLTNKRSLVEPGTLYDITCVDFSFFFCFSQPDTFVPPPFQQKHFYVLVDSRFKLKYRRQEQMHRESVS